MKVKLDLKHLKMESDEVDAAKFFSVAIAIILISYSRIWLHYHSSDPYAPGFEPLGVFSIVLVGIAVYWAWLIIKLFESNQPNNNRGKRIRG